MTIANKTTHANEFYLGVPGRSENYHLVCEGDIDYFATVDTLTRLALGSDGQFLRASGVSVWGHPIEEPDLVDCCRYCGGRDYRVNLRNQTECSGCGAPQ